MECQEDVHFPEFGVAWLEGVRVRGVLVNRSEIFFPQYFFNYSEISIDFVSV